MGASVPVYRDTGTHLRTSRTTPTAMSEASVMIDVRAPGLGCVRRVASARAVLTAVKAVRASSVQTRLVDRSWGWVSSLLRGCMIEE